MYIDLNIFPYVTQSRQLRHFIWSYSEVTALTEENFGWGGGNNFLNFWNPLSQRDGLQSITDKCFLNGNGIFYLKTCFGKKRGGGCSAKLRNRSLRFDVFSLDGRKISNYFISSAAKEYWLLMDLYPMFKHLFLLSCALWGDAKLLSCIPCPFGRTKGSMYCGRLHNTFQRLQDCQK